MVRALWLFMIVLIFGGSAVLLTFRHGAQDTRVYRPQEPQVNYQRSSPEVAPSKRPEQSSAPRKLFGTSQPDSTPVTDRSGSEEPASYIGSFSEVSRGSGKSPRIALAFDAGWEFKPTPIILDSLAKHGVRSTFFLTGRWVKNNREITRRIVADGHEIGNHTYSHKRLTEWSAGKIVEEVESTEELIVNLTGQSTKPLLRVPYGARDTRVLDVLKDEGYRSIYWDVDSLDGVKPDITPAEVKERVLGRVRNGSIVLMHCGSQATADALDSLLTQLKSDGYQPVTVGELLSD